MKNYPRILLQLLLMFYSAFASAQMCTIANSDWNWDAETNFNAATGNNMVEGDSYSACIYTETNKNYFSLQYDNGSAGNGSVTLTVTRRDELGNAVSSWTTSNVTNNYQYTNMPKWSTYTVDFTVNYGATASSFTVLSTQGNGGGANTATFSANIGSGGSGARLPVTYSSFTGQNLPKYNLLEWSTSSETDNSGFEVQRSSDGQSWQVLDFVDSALEGYATNYAYEDRTVRTFTNLYRLKQIDFDGDMAYSPIITITGSDPLALTLYPNPVDNQLHIDFSGAFAAEEVSVSCMNAGGAILMQRDLATGEALTVGHLPNGPYVLLISDGSTSMTRRFIKR